jgi:hypothetical protein
VNINTDELVARAREWLSSPTNREKLDEVGEGFVSLALVYFITRKVSSEYRPVVRAALLAVRSIDARQRRAEIRNNKLRKQMMGV